MKVEIGITLLVDQHNYVITYYDTKTALFNSDVYVLNVNYID